MRALLLALVFLAGCVSVTIRREGDLLGDMRALEVERGAAIRSGDSAELTRIYAADFLGVTSNGSMISREQLFAVFERTRANPALFEGSSSAVLTAKREGDVVVVTGRLNFGGADSMFMHVFRWRDDHWELFAASSTPER